MEALAFSQVNGERPSATGAGVLTVADGIIYSIIFILICSIVWLANREIRISRARTLATEKLLETQRNSLERRIAERTTAFVQAEERRMIELQRNAEFGKLSQGLFHDLMSPMSSISLYAEKNEVREVVDASRRLNSFMESVRRSLGNETISQTYANNISEDSINKPAADVRREIEIVRDIIGYKARMAGVRIEVEMDQKDPLFLPVHPVRLHQLILNLVSNAIDACIQESKSKENFECITNEKSEHVVMISAVKKKTTIELSVSDTGCGISKENQNRIFIDKFTTKSDGSGIGLMTIKTIVEQDLGGTIEVVSQEGKGAMFVVKVPKQFLKK